MIKATFVLLLFYSISANANKNCDPAACDTPKHYEELGCTPVQKEGECCPTRFNCPTRPKDNKCHYKGKTLELSEKLPEANHPECVRECRCSPSYSDKDTAVFNCANIECPDLFSPPRPECVSVGKLGECCGDIICDKSEIEELSKTKCTMNDQEYKKGEMMYLDDCYQCICAEGFDNTTLVGNKDCKRIDCSLEIHYADKIKHGCVPIYYEKSTCCPIDWRCPEEGDQVVAKERTEYKNDSNMICKFGDLTLNWGDELKSENTCISCQCLIPPMVHCIQNGHC